MSTRMARIPKEVYENATALAEARNISVGEALALMVSGSISQPVAPTQSPVSPETPDIERKEAAVSETQPDTPTPPSPDMASVLERLAKLEEAQEVIRSVVTDVIDSLEETQTEVLSLQAGFDTHLNQHKQGNINNALTREAMLEAVKAAKVRGDVPSALESKLAQTGGAA